MVTNKFFAGFLAKKKSKKGFTLVEALASIMILAIVFVGILNAVAFARQMVFTNNAKEKASDKAQLVSDEIIATATGYDPDAVDADINLAAAIEKVTNTSGDPQTDIIGEVTNVATFTDVSAFDPNVDDEIQYKLSPVSAVADDKTSGGVSYQQISEKGWNITVRVYYQKVNNNNSYDCVELSAFAPYSYIKN